MRRRNRTAACGPRPSDSGIEAGSGSRPTQRMLSCARCAALSFARKVNSAEYDRDASAKRRGSMRSTLRGPLGWALAARISTNGNAIKAALEKATGLRINVTVMTRYAAQVEAMCAGSVDMGFFAPLQMTLLLSKGCGTPVLGALRKDDTGQLATTYKSQILVKADSGIKDINGLKGKKFAFVDPLSASGYVYPTLVVKNKTGQDPKTFFSSTIFAGGHPQAALAVYQGTVDGAATFIDARDSLVATTPDIKTKTKVIDTAGPIPNDGVAVAKGFPDDVAKQVKQALIDYSKTDDGKKVFSALFSWDGIQEISPSFYDDMKTAAALAGVDVQGLANATPKPAATTAAPSPSKSP